MQRILRKIVQKFNHMLHAFTLVEILIVVSILGILALLSTNIGRVYVLRARDVLRKDDLDRSKIAIEDYYDSFGYFPAELPQCPLPFIVGTMMLLNRMPCDPKTGDSYRYVTDGTAKSKWFKFYTNLEYTDDRNIDDVGCRTGCGPDCKYNYGIASTNVELSGCTKLMPTLIPTPSPRPVFYVCAPGGGTEGVCEAYDDPDRSECPKVFPDDPTCQHDCKAKDHKCKNASGKYVPK
jgi:prepilin-type N-terminal cleavage/methylation domain-containing protein